MCFGIFTTRDLENQRERFKDNPTVLRFVEEEAKYVLGNRYVAPKPPEPEPEVWPVLDDEPVRAVPVFGEKEKVTA